jgi:hypothetical protein
LPTTPLDVELEDVVRAADPDRDASGRSDAIGVQVGGRGRRLELVVAVGRVEADVLPDQVEIVERTDLQRVGVLLRRAKPDAIVAPTKAKRLAGRRDGHTDDTERASRTAVTTVSFLTVSSSWLDHTAGVVPAGECQTGRGERALVTS